MRHTFASCRLVVDDEKREALAGYMGNSVDVIKDHYRVPIAKEQGEAFFNILPSTI